MISFISQYKKGLVRAAALFFILHSSFFILTGCTDTWDDHYAEKANANGTLWNAISQDNNLSNFKSVVEACGYDKYLDGSQVFTVFAPTNDQLTSEKAEALIAQYKQEKAAGVKDKKNSVIKEFVMNHIALYNYSTSASSTDVTLTMMNGKKMTFSNSAFDGVAYGDKKNYSASNGVLFSIGGVATFKPNVYEYLAKDSRLDSIRTYLYHYTLDDFQAEESVPGEIVDGKTHYLDSVTVEKNEIMEEWMGALLNDEDSTYWFIAPDNDVWKKQLAQNEKYFQYDALVEERDSFQYNYPRYYIFAGNAFSATENPKMLTETADSAMSTLSVPFSLRELAWGSADAKYFQYDQPFAENGIFRGTTDIACTNGKVMIPDSNRIDRSRTFLRTIVMEAEDPETLDSLNEVTTTNKKGNTVGNIRYVTSSNEYYNKVSGNGYLEIASTGTTTDFTKALFDVRNVLSNVPYDIYVVTAPEAAYSSSPTDYQKRNSGFKVTVQCHNTAGKAVYIPNDTKDYQELDVLDANNRATDNYDKRAVRTILTASGTEIDTLFVGRYTFPTCSWNTSEAQVKLTINGNGSSSTNRLLRLDCIIFKPVE